MARFHVFSGLFHFSTAGAVPSCVTTGDTHRLPRRSQPQSWRTSDWTKPARLCLARSRRWASEIFEVGLFSPDASTRTAGPVMIPRTWDVECVIRSIPWMRLQNLQGRNLYVRPHGEHDLTMVDDLKRESIDRMFASGFKPAVVVETSPGNFQAWLKHSRTLSKEVSTAAARTLAEDFGGDKGAADWRHFGRLAGFTNRKLKYQSAEGLFPFVRLHAADGAIYRESERFIEGVENRLAREKERAAQSRLQYPTRNAHSAPDH